MKFHYFFALTLLSSLSHAAAVPTPTPLATPTRKNKKFEIKVDPKTNQVDVYSPKSTNVRPENMNVTLYKDDKTGQTVRLRSVGPTEDGINHYQGRASIGEAPYVSFGFQFDLNPQPEPKKEEENE